MWQVERSVSDKEPRFMFRAVRSLHVLRKRINNNVLRAIISAYYPQSKEDLYCVCVCVCVCV